MLSRYNDFDMYPRLDSSVGRSDMMEAKQWIEAAKCAACPVCDPSIST